MNLNIERIDTVKGREVWAIIEYNGEISQTTQYDLRDIRDNLSQVNNHTTKFITLFHPNPAVSGAWEMGVQRAPCLRPGSMAPSL